MYNISVFSVCLICAWEKRRKKHVFLLYDLYGYSFFPYPTDATVFLKEKILTDDKQWTTHDDGRQRKVCRYTARVYVLCIEFVCFIYHLPGNRKISDNLWHCVYVP